MRTIFYTIIILLLSTSVYAFDMGLTINQNIYNNGRLDDARMLAIRLGNDNINLSISYEETYMRLMGLSAAEYKLFGVGIGHDSGQFHVSAGYYFANADTVYYGDGLYNESIHRYLNSRFGDRLWECYDVQASDSLGFTIGWRWKYFMVGIRFLRVPIKIIGWDKDSMADGHWHSIEREDFFCFSAGIRF